jgi:hypothetical protein
VHLGFVAARADFRAGGALRDGGTCEKGIPREEQESGYGERERPRCRHSGARNHVVFAPVIELA